MKQPVLAAAALPVAAAVLIVAIGAACGRVTRMEPQNVAVAGASPVTDVPIGPAPGPGSAAIAHVNPYGQDPVAVQEGRRLFVRFNCSGCHGGHAGGGMGPSLRDQDWMYGHTDAHIYDSIAEGRAHGMPAWATTLPDEYVWKLTAYIQSLGTDHEAEPPQ